MDYSWNEDAHPLKASKIAKISASLESPAPTNMEKESKSWSSTLQTTIPWQLGLVFLWLPHPIWISTSQQEEGSKFSASFICDISNLDFYFSLKLFFLDDAWSLGLKSENSIFLLDLNSSKDFRSSLIAKFEQRY